MPDVGPYDKYAIMWGYKPILSANSPEEELATLNQWILDKKGDPVYRYGRQGNPTVSALEEKVTRMEDGYSTLVFCDRYGCNRRLSTRLAA